MLSGLFLRMGQRNVESRAGLGSGGRFTKSFTLEEIDCARKLAFNSIPLMVSCSVVDQQGMLVVDHQGVRGSSAGC